MSLNIGDILQVTDIQNYLEQQVLNVFHYKVLAIPHPFTGFDEYGEVCRAYDAEVRVTMVQLQSSSLTHQFTRVDNLTNGLDFEVLGDTALGTLGGDALASFYALNFSLQRATKVTRNGSKRVAGVIEGDVNGNTWTGVGSQLTDFSTAISSNLVDSTPGTPVQFIQPVIVGRTKTAGKYHLDLSKINAITGASFTAVSTQRSRKAGRGV